MNILRHQGGGYYEKTHPDFEPFCRVHPVSRLMVMVNGKFIVRNRPIQFIYRISHSCGVVIAVCF